MYLIIYILLNGVTLFHFAVFLHLDYNGGTEKYYVHTVCFSFFLFFCLTFHCHHDKLFQSHFVLTFFTLILFPLFLNKLFLIYHMYIYHMSVHISYVLAIRLIYRIYRIYNKLFSRIARHFKF